MIKKRDYILPGTLVVLTALTGLTLSAPSASADTSGTVTLTVDVPASCSLTVNPSSHTVTINPGNTGLIGTSTIKSICNDPAGLAVYAVGYTNDTYGNNNLSSTVGANTINIATSVTPSGTPATSEWNMTLAAVSGDYTPTITTGFDSAHIIPDVYTKVAYRNAMTDIGTNATGAQFTASFNAYIAPTQAAGTYTGKVKFLLVHPNVMTWQEDSQNPGTMIPDEVQPATLARDPEAPVTFDIAYTDANKAKSGNYYTLQDMTSAICSDVSVGQAGTLIDTRDNQTYIVRKLKMSTDGSQSACWMSNLNIGAEPLVVSQLDSSNTHLTSNDSSISASTFNSWIKASSTQSVTNPDVIPITASNSDTGLDNDGINKYGTLYNYAAASAGTYVYAGGNQAYYGDATSDLCPSGWRLPTSNYDIDEFAVTINAYDLVTGTSWNTDSLTTFESTLGFSRAGDTSSGSSPSLQSVYGGYWSSTNSSVNGMNLYYYNENYSWPRISGYWRDNRDVAYSVRCIAQ